MYALLETLAVSMALAGSALVISMKPGRRVLGFTAFLVSSLATTPVMIHNELYSYSMLQILYICSAVAGIRNNLRGES